MLIILRTIIYFLRIISSGLTVYILMLIDEMKGDYYD